MADNDNDRDYRQVVSSAADAFDLFIPGIKAAIVELERKHGPLTHDSLRAYLIAAREMGEVSDAVLHLTKLAEKHYNTQYLSPEDVEIGDAAVNHLGHEIAQVIAVLVYMLINLYGDKVQADGEPIALVPGSDKVM